MKISGWIFAAALMVFLPSVSHAAVIYELSDSNGSLSSPPFARVTIEDISGDIQFTVELIGSELGGEAIEQFGFNTTSDLVGTTFNLPTDWSVDTSATQNLSSYGKFDIIVDIGSGSSQDPLVFTIVANGDSIADYIEANTNGQYFAVKIAAGAAGPGPFIGGAAAVPIPAALPLFLSGLAVFGFVGRRRRRAQAA